MLPSGSMSFVARNRNPTKPRPRNKRKNSLERMVLAALVILYVSIQLHIGQVSVISQDDLLFQLSSPPNAYFNNVPVRLRDANHRQEDLRQESFRSSVHCVGETHDPKTAWKHRSCTYVNLCIDLGETLNSSSGDGKPKKLPELFLVSAKSEKEFGKRFRGDSALDKFRYSSTELLKNKGNNNVSNDAAPTPYSPIDVALGGINPLWRASPKPRVPYETGIDKDRWAPKVYDKMPSEKYYELDPNVVLVPFHSFAAANPGHLLWDDFLPMYNLLKIFGYADDETNNNKGYQHLLLRVNTRAILFGSCDVRPKKKDACKKNFERFLPLFGVDPSTFSTLTEAKLTKEVVPNGREDQKQQQQQGKDPPSYPICAKRAVAGLGWLTDHGIRNHGWMANHEENSLDVALARNVGRGPELYAFRNFVLKNLGLEKASGTTAIDQRTWLGEKVSFRIILSARTSNHPDRSFGLEIQQNALQKAFPKAEVSILDFSGMPLIDQISLVSNQPPKDGTDISEQELRSPTQQKRQHQYHHTIFVSACGGGSLTAYFLSRGSSLILYYNEKGGMDYFHNEKETDGQALLDWDLMNNLGYLKVHWLPIGSMDEPESVDALVSLVQHEMDGILNGLVFR